jgi:hypothetical protein
MGIKVHPHGLRHAAITRALDLSHRADFDQRSDRQVGLLRCNCVSCAGTACAELKRTSATVGTMSVIFGRKHRVNRDVSARF